MLKPIEGEGGKGVVIGRFVDNDKWMEGFKKAFDEPDNFLLFEYVEPLHIDDNVASYRPIVEIMPDLKTNISRCICENKKRIWRWRYWIWQGRH